MKDNKLQTKKLIELLPQDPESQEILLARAENLVKAASTLQNIKQGINYVCFKLGENELYGIPYNYITEIIIYTQPTHVPFTNPSIAGIINRHGTLITVLDLARYFNIKVPAEQKHSHLIIVNYKEVTLAISVQAIISSDCFNMGTLSQPLQFEGSISPEYIQGLHKSTIAIINIENLLLDLQKNEKNIKESKT